MSQIIPQPHSDRKPDVTVTETPVDQWQRRYAQLGLATIPVKRNRKEAYCAGWPEVPPAEQWRQARANGPFRGNIAILAGNGVGFVDRDDPQTTINLERYLEALGFHPSELVNVTSPSGNGHYWLRVEGVPADAQNFYKLAVGPGELRIGRGAYVLAPCSATDAGRYRFPPGHAPENLVKQRPIHWRDLVKLIGVRPIQRSGTLATAPDLPIPLPYNEDLPSWVEHLLRHLAGLPSGMRSKRPRATLAGEWIEDAEHAPDFITYASRSEAEQAIIAHCVVQGWTLARIRELFEATQPGHYASMSPRHRLAYLERSYQNAIHFVSSTPQRVTLATWYDNAERLAASGRGGGTDYLIYRALLQRGWRASTLEPGVSIRDLALAASASTRTVQRSLKRLAARRLIQPVPRSKDTPFEHANIYRLNGLEAPPTAPPPASAIDALPGGAELWAVDKLGRTAGLVYARLTMEPQKISALAAATGKHRNSIRRALQRLEREGLAEQTRGGWIIGRASASTIAHEWDAPARKRQRINQVDSERDAYRAILLKRAAEKGRRSNAQRS